MEEREPGISPVKRFPCRLRLRRLEQAARLAGTSPESLLKRRLRVLREVRFLKMVDGSSPERENPGSRRPTTASFWHWTPDHEQGVGVVVFQRRVRPATAVRRERRADLLAARSDEDDEVTVMVMRRKRRRRREKNECGLFVILFFFFSSGYTGVLGKCYTEWSSLSLSLSVFNGVGCLPLLSSIKSWGL